MPVEEFLSIGSFIVDAILAPLRVAVLVSLALLAGCAGSAPNFEPAQLKPGGGVIYVYWPAHMLFGNHKGYATVSVDGHEIGEIGSGTYYAVPATPGRHVVSFKQPLSLSHALLGADEVSVNVQPGQSYYLRLTTVMHTPTAHSIYLREVDPASARAELPHTTRG